MAAPNHQSRLAGLLTTSMASIALELVVPSREWQPIRHCRRCRWRCCSHRRSQVAIGVAGHPGQYRRLEGEEYLVEGDRAFDELVVVGCFASAAHDSAGADLSLRRGDAVVGDGD